MMYQQVNLPDRTLVGAPGPLPANLVGLSNASLADISAGFPDAPAGLAHQGWWPVVTVPPAAVDPASQVVVDTPLVADPATSTVRNVQTVRPMTADESAAANPVPAGVTGTQGKLALLAAGKLDAAIAAIAAIPDATQKRVAQIKFDAANWFRADATLIALGKAIGLGDPDMDALFRAAVKIV